MPPESAADARALRRISEPKARSRQRSAPGEENRGLLVEWAHGIKATASTASEAEPLVAATGRTTGSGDAGPGHGSPTFARSSPQAGALSLMTGGAIPASSLSLRIEIFFPRELCPGGELQPGQTRH